MNEEIWAYVEGTNGLYQVSTLGRVKSLHYEKERIMKPSFRKRDKRYQLTFHINKKPITVKPHRLVAETFIQNPNNYEEVNHIDGNPLNNELSNLEWCTREQNLEHSLKTALNNPDKKTSVRKLNEKQVIKLIDDYNSKKFTTAELSKKYGISRAVIRDIMKGKSYKRITKKTDRSPANQSKNK